jgi:hypothetical protein
VDIACPLHSRGVLSSGGDAPGRDSEDVSSDAEVATESNTRTIQQVKNVTMSYSVYKEISTSLVWPYARKVSTFG